jgi:agmatinase
MTPLSITNLQPGTIAVVGVPTDENSSFLRGPAQAPARIRQLLHAGSANLTSENGFDLGQSDRWCDVGDLDLTAGFATIAPSISQLLASGARVVALGGDHAITFPLLQAHAAHYADLTILHIDAHADLYDNFDNNPHSHASPFARIMENGLARRLVQVGIRTLNNHQRAQAARFGVEIYEMKDWHDGIDLKLTGPLYVSLDLDGLDPAFAPGVSHHEPGGLTTRQLLTLIQQLPVPPVGADIVELNPIRDWADMTAMVAAKCLKEIVAKMV